MKTYNTYNARNAVKAAQVTNHIKAQKKLGVSHLAAKAEAYRLYNIKAAIPLIKNGLAEKAIRAAAVPNLPKEGDVNEKGWTYSAMGNVWLPPLPKIGA